GSGLLVTPKPEFLRGLPITIHQPPFTLPPGYTSHSYQSGQPPGSRSDWNTNFEQEGTGVKDLCCKKVPKMSRGRVRAAGYPYGRHYYSLREGYRVGLSQKAAKVTKFALPGVTGGSHEWTRIPLISASASRSLPPAPFIR